MSGNYKGGGGQGRPILGSNVTSVPSSLSSSSGLSASAAVFVPRSKDSDIDTSKKTPLEKLRELITTLKSNPAFYEEGLEKIANTFGTNVKDEQTLKEVVGELVKECIEEPNFRYTGARLCQAFSTDLNIGFPEGNFRQFLCKNVHKDYLQRDELVKTPDGKAYLCGLTLFMGELLRNLTVGNPKERVEQFSAAVLDLVSTCLNNPEEITIKNVIAVLKLTGCIIHHMEKKANCDNKTPNLDGIFLRLKNIVIEDTYPRNLRDALLRLIEDHATWDKQTDVLDIETPSPGTPHATDMSLPFTNEPTFYSATGQVITAEEAGFDPAEYDDGYYSGYHPDYSNYEEGAGPEIYGEPNGAGLADFGGGDDDELYVEDIERYNYIQNEHNASNEFDDEMAAAYEEFLNNQKNDARNQAASWR